MFGDRVDVCVQDGLLHISESLQSRLIGIDDVTFVGDYKYRVSELLHDSITNHRNTFE